MSIYHFDQIPSELISEHCAPETSMIVCIPAYKEDQLAASVQSLLGCDPVDSKLEIIVLINEPSRADKTTKLIHQKGYRELLNLKHSGKADIKLHSIYINNIPEKSFGVGRARKWLMDEASRRFKNSLSPVQVIISFDADSTCDPDYFKEIHRYFKDCGSRWAASIYFEHPVQESKGNELYLPIIYYELHLRYYINMQRLAGLPFAFQTLGSAMAVKAESYRKMGGMNTRQAGEDFYFLHKFIRINQCAEINTTRVVPSPRVSDRVPFGTGKAVRDILNSSRSPRTYNPKSFDGAGKMICLLPEIYELNPEKIVSDLINELDEPIRSYLFANQAVERIQEIRQHTSGYLSFRNRFFQWFDAFRFMKYLHYARDQMYPDIPVEEACRELFSQISQDVLEKDPLNYLKFLRKLDQNSKYGIE